MTTGDQSGSPSSDRDGLAPASFTTHDDGDAVVVRVTGELDAASADGLRAAIDAAFGAAPTVVALDLAALTFIDSVGISVIVSAHNRAVGGDASFELRRVPAPSRRVFEITRLTDVLTIRD